MEPEDTTWEQVARLLAAEVGELVLASAFRDVEIQRLLGENDLLRGESDLESDVAVHMVDYFNVKEVG